MVRLKLCFFLARKSQKCCAFLSGYNMSTCPITAVNSDHWVKVFTHFSPVTSLFFPLFITKYLVGRYAVSPHPQVLASIDDGPCLQHLLLPTLPNGDFLLLSILFINWNSTARKSCFFPPTYLFIKLLIFINIGSWVFILVYGLWSNTIIFLLSYQLWLWELLPVGCSVLLACPIIFWGLPYFFVQKVLNSSCVFPAPALESTILPRCPGPVYRRMVSRNQILGAKHAHCY